VIDFEWLDEFDSSVEAELGEMLAEAAVEDEAAGFPQLSLDDPMVANTKHLLVWLLPDERSGRQIPMALSLAAYLRVEPLDGDDRGVGEVSYVVRSAYRSLGITTMLLEKIGLELGVEGGWQGSGVSALRIWARGNHPAALRISLRFRRYRIVTARRECRLLIPLREGREVDPGAEGGPTVREAGGAAERAAAAELWAASGRRDRPPAEKRMLVTGSERLTGAVWFDPRSGDRTEYGTAGRVVALALAEDAEPGGPRALLVAALERMRDAGRRVGAIVVDAEDRALVHETRSLGFLHERTDVLYTVSGRAS
jgi:mycothiol synthase